MSTTLCEERNSKTPSLAMTKNASLDRSPTPSISGSANTPIRSAAGGREDQNTVM
jgi:hypothetical protein